MDSFKIGDKVVWSDKMYANKYYSHTVESVMNIVKTQQLSGSTLLSMDNAVEACDFRFELYKEEEMTEFDKSKLATGMRVVHKNGEVGIILKDIGVIAYTSGFNMIEDFDLPIFCGDMEDWKLIKVYKGFTIHRDVLNYSCLGELIWERKEETEQQKRIRELKATIDNASKQLEELMKEAK